MYLYLLGVYHTMYSNDFFSFLPNPGTSRRVSQLGCLMMLGCNLNEKRHEGIEIVYEMNLDYFM